MTEQTKHLITVRGTGNVKVKPDMVIINMTLETQKPEYEQTMEAATEAVALMTAAVTSAGFKKDDLKTTDFNVSTHYENQCDEHNNYKSVFAGYTCRQGLKLEFDFTNEMLSKALSAVTGAKVNPRLDIRFSVRDKAAVCEELLISAAENARTKAEILTKASGVKLGALVNIDYNWSEIQMYSQTEYAMEDRCMTMNLKAACAPEMEPEDISVNDSVTYVWEIN